MRLQSRYLFLLGVAGLLTFGLHAQAQGKKKDSAGRVDMSSLDNPKVDTTKIESSKGEATKAAGAADAGAKPNDQKVDISDLESRYWAPKDTDFTVVQNRTFTKEKRFALALQGGRLINDSYSEGYVYGFSGNYFLSERYGIEVTYSTSDLKNNEATEKLKEFGTGVLPDYSRMTNYYGVGFNWIPFYAKMSFLAKKILYFDMVITPTLGMMGYEQQTSAGAHDKTAFAYGLDFSQYFFFTKNFSLRVDLKNKWFKEEVVRYHSSGGVATGQKLRNKDSQTTQFLLGINYFF